ncbi:hypothetical protein G6711_02735 [Polynucleobacter paneuropaeus]|nr:hypothetical protein [Polynucleobacter paneuropaeus]
MSWPTVELGEVCHIYQPATLSKAELDLSGPYPVYGANGLIGTHSEFNHEEQQLLIGCRGSCGTVHLSQPNSWINGNAMVVRPKNPEELDVRYLMHLFKGAVDLRKIITGVAQPQITRQKLSPLKIQLPSQAKQKKIVAILDKAEEIKHKRELIIEKLENLGQSIFDEMFGDLQSNPYKLKLHKLSDLLTVQGGYAFKSNDFVEVGVKLLKISNVHKDSLTWGELDFLPNDYIEKHKSFALLENDIVLALTRPIIKSLSSVKVAVVGREDLPCLLNQRVARFIFNKNSEILPSFLLMFLKSKYFYNLVNKLCSVALQPNMSTKQLGDLMIPLPSLAQQYKLENILAKLDFLKNKNAAIEDINAKLLDSLSYTNFIDLRVANE